MRVLVTGGSGQVGGALLSVIRPPGSVLAPGRKDFDLARPERLALELEHIAPELIVNAAAYTAVDHAESERELAFRINAEAPRIIAHWAAKHRVPLIHFSTDYVFEGSGMRPWREDDPPIPLSNYGVSKLAGDIAVRAAGGPHLIIRTSWVYAAKGTNFLRTILRLAMERKELRIVADQHGAPTSARLIADAVGRIIGQSGSGLADCFAASQGLINIAASGETTWHGFAVAIVEGLKARGVPLVVETVAPIATRDYPTKAQRPANSRLDLTCLQRVLGITATSWDRALAVELDLVADEFGRQRLSCHTS